MFAYNKHIYIVGEASKTTEVFDINGSKLICKENINYESVDIPILVCFFGKKNGKFVDFVQRIINLKTGLDKSFKCEKITFIKDAVVCLKVSNA
jgi:hypothetical protein